VTIYIANTCFEEELTQPTKHSLVQLFEKNPIYLQLQFLPFLFAGPEDGVCVTAKPNEEFWETLKQHHIQFPKLHLFSEKTLPGYSQVESWGASLNIADFAKTRNLNYALPPWQIVQKVNSKAYSHTCCPLPGSALLHHRAETQEWLKKIEGPKVFKTCFGLSGKGHFHWDPEHPEKIYPLLEREWKENRPVIGEPWVKRTFDFSTQWLIGAEIDYLGATLCESDDKGVHRQNTVGEESILFGKNLPFLLQHKQVVLPILQEMQSLGFFGNVGIDAFIYEESKLHPVVEINARKTMGWAALEIQRKHFPDLMLSLQFLKNADRNFLPSRLMRSDQKHVQFTRCLNLFTFK
jgi:hypothetical protein